MSPRPSSLSYLTELRHLETYLGATEADLNRVSSQVASGEGFVRYMQSRNGKTRQITFVIDEELRRIHGRILDLLTPAGEDLPANIHAFIRGRSIRSNALQHIGARFTQTYDLADFFTQVRRSRVTAGLVHFGAAQKIGAAIAGLTTVDDALPMGFMTSPMLANLALYEFDADLLRVASERGLEVSRYADDIVFSSSTRFDVATGIAEVAQRHGLRLNPAKSRTARTGQRMLVTGLSIANQDRPRLPRAYRARIRQELHYISKFGLEGHADRLQLSERYVSKRLGGRIAYAESIDPAWVRSLEASYPVAFKQVSPSGSPRSADKRAASLRRLAERVRGRDKVSLPKYASSTTYGGTRSVGGKKATQP